jgi:hypothetical protein
MHCSALQPRHQHRKPIPEERQSGLQHGEHPGDAPITSARERHGLRGQRHDPSGAGKDRRQKLIDADGNPDCSGWWALSSIITCRCG